MLAVKLGRWDMFKKLVDKARGILSHEAMNDIFSHRDGMGLQLLSYAVALRAPEAVIVDCLSFTDKYSFYIDHRYAEIVEGADQTKVESCVLYPTENAYIHQDDIESADPKSQRGFQIYALDLCAFYKADWPRDIRVHGDIDDHNDFLIQTKDEKGGEYHPFHQVLRNLMFHLQALCDSRGILAAPRPKSICRSIDKHAFDVKTSYPRLAEARNADYQPKIEQLLESWQKHPIHKGRWTIPLEPELSTIKDKPAGPAASK